MPAPRADTQGRTIRSHGAEVRHAMEREHVAIVPARRLAGLVLPRRAGHPHDVITVDDHVRVLEALVSAGAAADDLAMQRPVAKVRRAPQRNHVARGRNLGVGERPVLLALVVPHDRELALLLEPAVPLEFGAGPAGRLHHTDSEEAIGQLRRRNVHDAAAGRRHRDALVLEARRAGAAGERPAVRIGEVSVFGGGGKAVAALGAAGHGLPDAAVGDNDAGGRVAGVEGQKGAVVELGEVVVDGRPDHACSTRVAV